MKILRDQAGQVVIARPRFGAAPQPQPSSQPYLVPPQSASTPAPHCLFYCKWCNAEILLPHTSLGLAFGPPAVRRIEVRSIATVCAACSHVSGYSLFRGSYGFDTRHKLTQAAPSGVTTLVDWLACEEETCVARMALFLHAEQAPTGDIIKVLAQTWHWEDLECSAGHAINLPRWVFAREPHKFPAPLR